MVHEVCSKFSKCVVRLLVYEKNHAANTNIYINNNIFILRFIFRPRSRSLRVDA
jgi:hypothetical protein